MMEAARMLALSGAKPKRTIVFIAFAGEEFGLLGSKAYCEKHQQELPKIVNVFNRDGGPEPPVGIAVSQAMYDDFVEITKPIQKVRADIPFEVTVRPPRKRPKVAGGTDSEVFISTMGKSGIPNGICLPRISRNIWSIRQRSPRSLS